MRFLLVRLRLIGDVVFTTPIPRALKRSFPGAHVSYLVEKSAAAVVAGNRDVDEVIVVERPKGAGRILADLKLAMQLRRSRYDVVIDLHGGPRASFLTWATGARQRIGYTIRGRSWMYTRTVDRPRELRPRHSVVNQWDLLESVEGWSGGPADPRRDPVQMAADGTAGARMATRLEAAGIAQDDELVVVHVSAGNPFRRWPEESFISLVHGIASGSPRRRVVLSSGPSDRDAAARIGAAVRSRLGDAAGRVVDIGEFDLAELRALVARSRLFVGGDTGPLHIAATTATPIVGIYGPTLAERSAPWRDPSIPTASLFVADLACRPCDQRACVPGDFRCLTTLKPQDVLQAAEQLMKADA